MRMRVAVVGLVAVPCLFAYAAHAQIAARYAAKGQASWKGASMTFRSAIARWDAGQKELQVGLFPFEVTDEDVKKVADWRMVFYATVGKPSPDPAKWKEPPYLVVMLRFDGDKEAYTVDDAKVYTLNVTAWKGNSTIAIPLGGADMKKVITELSFSPGAIKGHKAIMIEEALEDPSQALGN